MYLRKIKRPTAALIVVITLIVGVAAIYSAIRIDLRGSATKYIHEQQREYVASVANQIGQYFYDIQKRIETTAVTSDVRDAQRGEACNAKLQRLVEVNRQELNNLGRISKDGVFVCAVNRTLIGEPVSKYGDYFKKIASDPQHKPAMSRLIFPTGSASSVVAMHVPVFDSKGNFDGTIGGAVYFEELQNYIQANNQVSKNAVLTIYDNNLDILHSPDPLLRGKNLASADVRRLYSPSTVDRFIKEIREGKTGEIEYRMNNADWHVAYRAVPVIDRNWTVVIAAPTRDIQTLSDQNKPQFSFAVSAVLFIAMATIVIFSFSLNKTKKQAKKK